MGHHRTACGRVRRRRRRTRREAASIFAVGDDKQSIYSFQGADPAQFHERQRSFERDFNAAELEWRNVRLDYRSARTTAC